MDWKVLVAAPLVAVLVVASAGEVAMPRYWSHSSTGVTNQAYAIGLDPGVSWNGERSLSVHSRLVNDDVDYGAAIQYVNAFGYGGRRVRFSGMLKTTGITGWSGVFLQANARNVETFWGNLASVEELPRGSGGMRGSSDWHRVSVVLDVPDVPGSIGMGLALVGNGQAWLSDLKFEEVGPDVPVSAEPIGLDVAKLSERRRKRLEQERPAPKEQPYNLGLEP